MVGKEISIVHEEVAEIAYVAGGLAAEGKIDVSDYDMNERYRKIYLPIYETWIIGRSRRQKTLFFKSEAEEKNLTIYAKRCLIEGSERHRKQKGRGVKEI